MAAIKLNRHLVATKKQDNPKPLIINTLKQK
ncbi:MAG: hypothetical protein ACI935_000093 [Moritella dasanensis]|jgi:hypothetical protein